MSSSPPSPATGRTTPSQVFGEILVTVGVLVLLFVFYESFWTNLQSHRLQGDAQQGLEQQWTNPRAANAASLGDAFARLHIPSFGADYRYALIEGVDAKDLLAGPGRYPGTQLPGQDGNFAVAGHRVGKGAPFNDLGRLATCDAIVVETQAQWVTYRVLPMSTDPAERAAETAPCLSGAQAQRIATGDYAHVAGRHITVPSDIEVINPLPGSPETEPVAGLEGLITLTTCHPQFSNAERMIVHAVRTEVLDKNVGQPAALTEVM